MMSRIQAWAARSLAAFTLATGVFAGESVQAGVVTPNIIFGSGVTNGGFTIARSDGVELGLRAKLRFDENNQPTNQFNKSVNEPIYTFDAGAAPGGFGAPYDTTKTPVWNFEFSIDTDYLNTSGLVDQNRTLDKFDFALRIDTDPSSAVSYFDPFNPDPFDPVNGPYFDHAIGTNQTATGAGTVATDSGSTSKEEIYESLLANNTVAQNSWNYVFFPFAFNPTINGEYQIELSATADGVSPFSTAITVLVVGAEESSIVPEPASLAIFGLAAIGLVVAASGRRPKSPFAPRQ